MATIPGTNVAAMVVPFDDQDIFATHNDKYGRGGFRVCDTLADRDAITELRRKAGMWVRVMETGLVYELAGDLVTWAEVQFSGGSSSQSANQVVIEAGENLLAGTPVKVVANLLQTARHTDTPNPVGILRADAMTGFTGTAVTSGTISLSGLTAGPYYLGNGVITATPPNTGYLVRIGHAINNTILIVNIEEPIYLA